MQSHRFYTNRLAGVPSSLVANLIDAESDIVDAIVARNPSPAVRRWARRQDRRFDQILNALS